MQSTRYSNPGQLIQELLEIKGWSQRVLSIMMEVDESTVSKLISGARPIDAPLALLLSKTFGFPAESFLELQKSHELVQARLTLQPDKSQSSRAYLFGNLPVAEMIKRGWLNAEDIRHVPKVESELARFFGVSSPDEIEIFPHAAKKTKVSADVSPSQLAWLYRVKEIAGEMLVAKYSATAVKDAVSNMKPLRASAEAARKVPRLLAECGIRFVIVESLPGAKIDGVCFWLDQKAPVIGMTLRYDRIDNFWFVLRHELEHVVQLHGQAGVMFDSELEGEKAGTGTNLSEEERIANEAAQEFCVPNRSIESFIARKAPFFHERDIIGFANTLGVHPGLVAGQLQRRIDRYDRFRNHLVKIRSIITPNAMVDGWGDVAPVG